MYYINSHQTNELQYSLPIVVFNGLMIILNNWLNINFPFEELCIVGSILVSYYLLLQNMCIFDVKYENWFHHILKICSIYSILTVWYMITHTTNMHVLFGLLGMNLIKIILTQIYFLYKKYTFYSEQYMPLGQMKNIDDDFSQLVKMIYFHNFTLLLSIIGSYSVYYYFHDTVKTIIGVTYCMLLIMKQNNLIFNFNNIQFRTSECYLENILQEFLVPVMDVVTIFSE